MSSNSHSHEHHDENFIQKYIFSVDHKIIGIQYGITSLLFLLFGFSLVAIMRWQLAYPDTAVPIVGFLFGESGTLISLADLVILGGTLTPVGGHNIIAVLCFFELLNLFKKNDSNRSAKDKEPFIFQLAVINLL